MILMCNGMGRSGSTYQYNLARLFARETGGSDAHGFVAPESESHTLSVSDGQVIAWANADSYEILKMHSVHPMLPEFLEASIVRVLYIYRDVRDVAVSLKRVWNMRGERLERRLDNHVRSYNALLELRESYPQSFLWQRYEEVMADKLGAAREVQDFVGVEVDEDTFCEIVAECSIEAAEVRCDATQEQLAETVTALKASGPRPNTSDRSNRDA